MLSSAPCSPASHTQLVPQRPRPVAPELMITKPATAAPTTSTCPPGPCVILTVTLWSGTFVVPMVQMGQGRLEQQRTRSGQPALPWRPHWISTPGQKPPEGSRAGETAKGSLGLGPFHGPSLRPLLAAEDFREAANQRQARQWGLETAAFVPVERLNGNLPPFQNFPEPGLRRGRPATGPGGRGWSGPGEAGPEPGLTPLLVPAKPNSLQEGPVPVGMGAEREGHHVCRA